MSASSVSGTRRRSLVALSGLSVVAEAGTVMAMAPVAAPVAVNLTVSPNYMEPVRLVQFNPALAAVVMAMIVCFFLVGLATGHLKKCIRPAEADSEEEVAQRRGRSPSKSECGLDPEVLEALPRVQYKDLSPGDKYFDCPVCLAPFDANDNLRLLPECSHVFHSDCIDAWFLLRSTCPLCRASLLPVEKALREGDAEDGEQAAIHVDVVEVVIGGNLEQDRSRRAAISGSLQERTGGAPMSNSSTVEDKEQGIAHPFLRSAAVGAFKPAVRIGIAPEKAAAVASIRRSNSDLQLLQPCYVVDSEGTQLNRNYQAHVIDVEEFLLNDHGGAQALNPCESSSRHPQPASRLGLQMVQPARWSSPNLRQFAPAESSER